MEIYILKFSACLAVFMIFYKLFLEKESFHKFKRFYLLAALSLAIIIPLITFTTYVEPIVTLVQETSDFSTPPNVPEYMFEEPVNYWPQVLWSLYFLGVLIFAIRFGMNLFKIVKRIKENPKFRNQSIVHVLLTDLIQPHTFLNYIFFNKAKYESHEIPEEVMVHEETHAKEKHALDILFIELLQIVFWFNPLLYFIKKDIKLNHEFLADRAVLNHGIQIKNYQNTLLTFSSHVQEPALANAINYSSIKKRFTVMKTHTSKSAFWIRSLILLPLLAILIYSFSTTKHVEKDMVSESLLANYTAKSIDIDVLENGTFNIDGITATKKTFGSVINELHQDITPEIRNQIINVHVNNGKAVSNEDVWFIYNSVIDYGFHRIVTYNQEIIREKGNKPFAIESSDLQKGASKEQIVEYNKLAKHCSNQIKKQGVVKQKDVERIKLLFNLLTEEQKRSAESFPDLSKLPPPPKNPNDSQTETVPKIYDRVCDTCEFILTKEDLRNLKIETNTNEPIASFNIKFVGKPTVRVTGNSLNGQALSYLQETSENAIIQLFNLKTATTKIKPPVLITLVDKSNLPPPPPPPVPNDATPEQQANYKKVQEEYKTKYNVSNGKVSENPPPPPPPVPQDATPEQKAKYKKVSEEYYKKYQVKDGKVYYKNPPPPPPSSKDDTPTPQSTPKSGFIDINGEKSYFATVEGKTKYYNRWGKEIDKEGKELTGIQTDGDKVLPNQNITKVYQNDQVVSEFNKNWESNNDPQDPPPPPPPVSALDFVIAMAKKDRAMFFYEGRSVSSDKAISVMKKNPDLNINAKNSGSESPRVFITKAPVNHDSQDFREIQKPTAENAVSHIKVMHRHNAKFYLNGKEVTYEDALKAVRKNKNADINSTYEPPVVNIKN